MPLLLNDFALLISEEALGCEWMLLYEATWKGI